MHGDDHFGNRITGKGRGCGAKIWDEEAKPGDHLRKLEPMGKREKRLKILKIVLIIIFLPIVLVLYIPVKSVKADWRRT